ncbi:MAG: arylsulfatase [Vicinamibacterales bacterium]|nr:arylsulfatase [Vicinamibacterales bacterium]MDP6609671.1 arylsulfatase [Vicinamibacterales bacterium]
MTPPPARHALIVLLGLATACGTTTSPESRADAPPNVVLIMADDMGFSDIGPYGSEIPTPNLDRLAAEGRRFTQFYNTARCSPTRAALLTGVYPHQAGVGHLNRDLGAPGYRGELAEVTVTLAELLGSAGYTTLMSGKWHVTSPSLTDDRNWPRQRGFDRFYGTLTGGGNFFNPATLILDDTPIQAEGDRYHYTDAISDRAVEFLDDLPTGEAATAPFFLYVAYTAPHWPLHAWPDDVATHVGGYLDGWDVLRERRRQRLIDLGMIDAGWVLSTRDPDAAAWEDGDHTIWEDRRMAVYAAQVEQMDRGIGRILAKVRALGAEANTLVLFLSDNGGSAELISPDSRNPVFPTETRDGRPIRLGNVPEILPGDEDTYQSYGVAWANASNTPFRRFKHWVHEGGIATPLIVSWPTGIASRGELEQTPAHVIDLLPTIAEATGTTYPARRNGVATIPLEGESLIPVFEGGAMMPDRPLYWEHEGNRAIRRGRWKLVAPYQGEWELYDLQVDRTETSDLAAQRPAIAAELSGLWESWAARVGVVPWQDVRPR